LASGANEASGVSASQDDIANANATMAPNTPTDLFTPVIGTA
jgi:hypothetical protein